MICRSLKCLKGNHQKSKNFQNLLRLTQDFSYIKRNLCRRYLQRFKSILQKQFHCCAQSAVFNVLKVRSPALQSHLDKSAKLCDIAAFLACNSSYANVAAAFSSEIGSGLLTFTLLRYQYR